MGLFTNLMPLIINFQAEAFIGGEGILLQDNYWMDAGPDYRSSWCMAW
jgi:hypothetical protein